MGCTDFYDDQDRHNFGRLDLFQFTSSIATSSYFPVYNGRFWDIFIGTDGITGSNPTVSFGAYQANHLKEVDFVTSSVSITEKQMSELVKETRRIEIIMGSQDLKTRECEKGALNFRRKTS